MKPPRFDYARPDTLDEALSLLAERGDRARVLAGGQSLAAMLNMRLVAPDVLVDIARLDQLKSIQLLDDTIEVGAAVTQESLRSWPDLSANQPLLAQILPWVGHYATRQRGTVVGSIVHSDPSSEMPLALAVLEGEVVLRRTAGERVASARDFQQGMLQTDVDADEVVVAARFPRLRPHAVTTFLEVSQRHGDFALVAVAAIGDEDGVRLGVGGVADVPAVEAIPWMDDDGLDAALNAFAWRLKGSDDIHASASYRRQLVRRLGRRALEEIRDALPGS